jgi:hypothetical protein
MSIFCIAAACFFLGIALTCVIDMVRAFCSNLNPTALRPFKKRAKADEPAAVDAPVTLVQRQKKPVITHNRFIVFCVTLSVAIVAFVLALLFLTSRTEVVLDYTTLIYFGVFVLLGAIAKKWYRIMIPVLLLLYLFYALFAITSLIRFFPHPRHVNFSVQVNAESVTVGNTEYPGIVGDCALVFECYTMPSRWLVPFPLQIIRFAGIVLAEQPDAFVPPQVLSPARAFTSEGTPLAVARTQPRFFSIMGIPLFADALFASQNEVRLNIPRQQILPAMYVANGEIQRGKPVFTLSKVF